MSQRTTMSLCGREEEVIMGSSMEDMLADREAGGHDVDEEEEEGDIEEEMEEDIEEQQDDDNFCDTCGRELNGSSSCLGCGPLHEDLEDQPDDADYCDTCGRELNGSSSCRVCSPGPFDETDESEDPETEVCEAHEHEGFAIHENESDDLESEVFENESGVHESEVFENELGVHESEVLTIHTSDSECAENKNPGVSEVHRSEVPELVLPNSEVPEVHESEVPEVHESEVHESGYWLCNFCGNRNGSTRVWCAWRSCPTNDEEVVTTVGKGNGNGKRRRRWAQHVFSATSQSAV